MKDYSPAIFYASYYPIIRDEAHKHGYAVALHGSMSRDMDIIAVPWREEVSEHGVLIRSIADRLGMTIPSLRTSADGRPERNPDLRPHGRQAYAVLCEAGLYIDISVMPKI